MSGRARRRKHSRSNINRSLRNPIEPLDPWNGKPSSKPPERRAEPRRPLRRLYPSPTTEWDDAKLSSPRPAGPRVRIHLPPAASPERTVGRAAAGAAYGPSRRAAVRPRAPNRPRGEALVEHHACGMTGEAVVVDRVG